MNGIRGGGGTGQINSTNGSNESNPINSNKNVNNMGKIFKQANPEESDENVDQLLMQKYGKKLSDIESALNKQENKQITLSQIKKPKIDWLGLIWPGGTDTDLNTDDFLYAVEKPKGRKEQFILVKRVDLGENKYQYQQVGEADIQELLKN